MPIQKNRRHVVSGYDATAEEFAADAVREAAAREPSRRRFLKTLPPKGTVLEIGCGAGLESKWFADQGFDVLALDPSKKLISLAKQDDHGVRFRVGTIEDAKTKEGPFDGIWCNRVFHHLHTEEREHFLANVASRLKPGGTLYLSARITELEPDQATMIHFIPRFDVSEAGLMDLAKENGLEFVTSEEWDRQPPWKEFLLRKA